LVIGMVGIGVSSYGGWTDSKFGPVLLASASGVFFGLVLVGLRAQRDNACRRMG
jgi:hypothetical protein